VELKWIRADEIGKEKPDFQIAKDQSFSAKDTVKA
jgi:hypothetical protein